MLAGLPGGHLASLGNPGVVIRMKDRDAYPRISAKKSLLVA